MDSQSNVAQADCSHLHDTATTVTLSEKGMITLPDLSRFTQLSSLHCSHNALIRLPDSLPPTLTFLRCGFNRLESLPEVLPPKLFLLYCSTNCLSALPEVLPPFLKYLECSANAITELPSNLPELLYYLNCSKNRLRTLPATLPATLTSLNMRCNNIRQFPDLHHLQVLRMFDCSENPCTRLPILPDNLEILMCEHCEFLVSLPHSLPPSLHQLDFRNNPRIVFNVPCLPEGLGWIACEKTPYYELFIAMGLTIPQETSLNYAMNRGGRVTDRFRYNFECYQRRKHWVMSQKYCRHFRYWLWERVRRPKVEAAFHFRRLEDIVAAVGEEGDLDEALEKYTKLHDV